MALLSKTYQYEKNRDLILKGSEFLRGLSEKEYRFYREFFEFLEMPDGATIIRSSEAVNISEEERKMQIEFAERDFIRFKKKIEDFSKSFENLL